LFHCIPQKECGGPKNEERLVYKIDKDVPTPPETKKKPRGRPRLYPFKEMEPGDSFYVETKKPLVVQRSAETERRRHGCWYTTEIYYDANVTPIGIRVWRIK
jgi:hypothetical protein